MFSQLQTEKGFGGKLHPRRLIREVRELVVVAH
jgi:hypothetical protein